MGTSQTRATIRYNEKAYDRLYIRVKKGEKEQIREIAEASGYSLNSFIVEAIFEKVERETSFKIRETL